ncbi:hypothetical protein GCM10009841_25930 [Microlunatus panaciterrae]|uniref:Uncharacterized protein n=1 Tax=Microlunatus panaciterrae TaxID=400768 RepID=A0ABS2RJH2_9ACTN|nr:hypothetical protein [Microlunatus panaciterrae]
MYRSSEVLDLNQWAVRDALVADPHTHGLTQGPNLSALAAERSALLQALADRAPAAADSRRLRLPRLARLWRAAPVKSPA